MKDLMRMSINSILVLMAADTVVTLSLSSSTAMVLKVMLNCPWLIPTIKLVSLLTKTVADTSVTAVEMEEKSRDNAALVISSTWL